MIAKAGAEAMTDAQRVAVSLIVSPLGLSFVEGIYHMFPDQYDAARGVGGGGDDGGGSGEAAAAAALAPAPADTPSTDDINAFEVALAALAADDDPSP